MSKLIINKEYKRVLDRRQTEHGIKLVKDFFQQNLSTELRLQRVTAPLFVLKGLGINDDLNGTERPVTFPSSTWATPKPKWCTRWPSGNGSRWLNTRLNRATASIPT